VDHPVESETGRLEAFSDGVLAVIITIMALELRAPGGSSFGDLRQRLPSLLIYILSFAFIGIYWNNHHHLLRATTKISAWVMWANLHLLFWLSLIPVVTEWIGVSYDHTAPAATYSIVALADSLAYSLLVVAIVKTEGPGSKVALALGSNFKGRLSTLIYAVSTGVAFLDPRISYALLATVAIMWFVPDRRLERPPVPRE
jgi:uncharacterized membrane protein